MFTRSFVESNDQKEARRILGKGFLGIPEVITHFGFHPRANVRAALETIPFDREFLHSVRDQYFLVAGFPVNLLQIRRRQPSLFSHRRSWFDWSILERRFSTQRFAKEKMRTDWYLFPRSINEIPCVRYQLENLPTMCEAAFALMLNLLCNQERLFHNPHTSLGSFLTRDHTDWRGGVSFNFQAAGMLIDYEDLIQVPGFPRASSRFVVKRAA